MAKHIFRISLFYKVGNGGGMGQKLIEVETTDISFPYTLEDAWDYAINVAGEDLQGVGVDNLKSMTVLYEGKLDE